VISSQYPDGPGFGLAFTTWQTVWFEQYPDIRSTGLRHNQIGRLFTAFPKQPEIVLQVRS